MLTQAARLIDMVSGIGGADETFDGPYFPVVYEADPEPAPVAAAPAATEPAPVVARLVPAPVASAIILAVAEFWHTDNKTAARWITERAAEIEGMR